MLKRIPLEKITRNPDQPRQTFEPRALADLAASIKENGLKQPITVRPVDGPVPYMIVMGERRYRAHCLLAEAGETVDILCHVRKMDDREMHIDAILENLQRAEVSPLEEAAAYQRAIDDLGFTVPELAKKLGVSQHWRITDRIRLLGLTDDNRQLLATGIITQTQAYHMARLSPNGQQTFVKLCAQGLVSTNQAAEQAAAAIEAKENQIDMPMVIDMPKRVSIKSTENRIDALGAALQPLFKDGAFKVDGNIDTAEAQRCIEKLKLLARNIGQVEREILRAASVSAAA
ncbi:ParB/RepB/Spo0J family partition protein [Sulfitobacter pseudonitzschiae]|uniref:ParB/RepB/Spo0J family partition protein n=1 Tax=Pseudosulfitobacter pseudonitzschiae TaxID=1402135 RepID=A0A9Q2NRJ4_9RHOB|nr:ParB/RepB/Spo0J family partition protein [Pseudosulfitobacter pseudonitzschiae]MBM2293767.1 ParB/RepB/Spo0J family partition protein [Pseudosulfitobacter pseudonitzschiae]MBM2298685.1 ParB/RepB/Spo0J family partition protein [Pseudosulfitobacter pseudonitzschiae]MBM2303599.1 ParB/RepB/Spo0J family partition protein [Pseudosulfitobacter pseudonitzschiae]MBM2313382.1 ParB/RepB/Spo0J family partition protein [Pseudosulfitobacter pseudonitzschiae]MBM2318295.1 ParB/RepB/Spo0J family partition pr